MVEINLATVKHTRQAIYALVFLLIYGCAAGPSGVEVEALNKRIARLERSLDERGAQLEELESKFRLLREKRGEAEQPRYIEAEAFSPPPGLKVIRLGDKSVLRIKGLPDKDGSSKTGGLAEEKGHGNNEKNQPALPQTNLTKKGPAGSSAPPSPASPLSAEAMYKKARKLFLAGKDEKARAVFMDLTRVYPESSLADNAYYWSAESYYRKKEFKDAIVMYKTVAEQYPKSNKAADALLGLGVVYRKIKNGDGAAAAWDRVIKDYPDSDAAKGALKRLQLLQSEKEGVL